MGDLYRERVDEPETFEGVRAGAVVDITARSDKLILRPGPTIPREALVRGSYVKTEDGFAVTIERQGPFPIVLHLRTREQARRLLDKLGLGPDAAPFRMRISSRLKGASELGFGAVGIGGPFAAWLAAVPFLEPPARAPVAAGAAAFVTLVCLALWIAPTKVRVDADGVTLSWLGRVRKVPFVRIAYVRSLTARMRYGNAIHTIELETGLGELTHLVVGHNAFGAERRACALLFRIEDGLAAWKVRAIRSLDED